VEQRLDGMEMALCISDVTISNKRYTISFSCKNEYNKIEYKNFYYSRSKLYFLNQQRTNSKNGNSLQIKKISNRVYGLRSVGKCILKYCSTLFTIFKKFSKRYKDTMFYKKII
jgi:hypothetical protein